MRRSLNGAERLTREVSMSSQPVCVSQYQWGGGGGGGGEVGGGGGGGCVQSQLR